MMWVGELAGGVSRSGEYTVYRLTTAYSAWHEPGAGLPALVGVKPTLAQAKELCEEHAANEHPGVSPSR